MTTELSGSLSSIEGFWYVATVYSAHPKGLDQAFADASTIMGALVKSGYSVFSPIVHGHPISKLGGIDPLDHSFWMKFDEAMMNASGGLLVAKMDGWENSKGIAIEIEHFKKAGKPIEYLDVETRKAA